MVEKTPLHALHSNHINGMESTIKKTQTVQQLKLCWVRPEHVSSQNVSFNNLEVVFALFSTIYNFTWFINLSIIHILYIPTFLELRIVDWQIKEHSSKQLTSLKFLFSPSSNQMVQFFWPNRRWVRLGRERKVQEGLRLLLLKWSQRPQLNQNLVLLGSPHDPRANHAKAKTPKTARRVGILLPCMAGVRGRLTWLLKRPTMSALLHPPKRWEFTVHDWKQKWPFRSNLYS